jgi:hypothetical protein
VSHNENRDLRDLFGFGPRGDERPTKICEDLPSLSSKVSGTHNIAVFVLGLLTRNEDQPGSRRDDDMAVGRGHWKI